MLLSKSKGLINKRELFFQFFLKQINKQEDIRCSKFNASYLAPMFTENYPITIKAGEIKAQVLETYIST
jgi:hypothetical protein